ncbi:MAG: AAA family ATPase [Actinomycetota bacterium]
MPAPATIAELRSAGYPDRTVKQELSANLAKRLAARQPMFEKIIGFGDSVLPALERGILACHDIILLGERGQAKTRLIRKLVDLLDESIPVIAGCEINDHPYHPICAACRAAVAEQGDLTPITWIGRETRFSEKLATPDTSVADLIGDVDPIRVAEGRYLSDELTIHYGLIPRTNRGILSINELPDLPERIQVSLLNILEERDVQIRGFKVRLPLDLLLVASANPEDYTHRGRIISPLKDRFGSQVRTHYPEVPEDEILIMDQEAKTPSVDVPVHVPEFLKEILAEYTAQLRRSPKINQHSGVSVRYSIGNLETLMASAVRRAVLSSEQVAVARPVDLWALMETSMGRIEFDTMEEGREPRILLGAMKAAIADVFRRRLGGFNFGPWVEQFDEGLEVTSSDTQPATEFLDQFGTIPGLTALLSKLDIAQESPAQAAAAIEFALEGLHLTRRVNKYAGGRGSWRFGS